MKSKKQTKNIIQFNESLTDGFLSVEHGFMPASLIKPLSGIFVVWEDLASRLQDLYYQGTDQAFHDLPILDANQLKTKDLQRAATLLGHFAQAWWRNRATVDVLPECIDVPWTIVSKRLGRCGNFLAYADLMLTNFTFKDPKAADKYALENLEMSVRAFHNSSEDIFLMAITEMHARANPIIGAAKNLLAASIKQDNAAMKKNIRIIKKSVIDAREAFYKISANKYSPTYCPPTDWSLSIAKWYVPSDDYIGGGVSGLSSPLFHLLDKIINRNQHESYFGREKQNYNKLHPVKWQNFLDQTPWYKIYNAIMRAPPEVQQCWDSLLVAYRGDHSLLDSHKAKVFGYIQIAALVGRAQFTSGHKVDVKKEGWHKLNNNLTRSQTERHKAQWNNTHVESRHLIAKCDGVRRITLPIDLDAEPGDRVMLRIGARRPRYYSISWTDDEGIHINVGRIDNGIYSNQLNCPENKPLNVKAKLSIARDFKLPKNDTPIVMYAGGSGVSPFIGFIKKRIERGHYDNTLYFSYHGEDMCWYSDWLQYNHDLGYIKLIRIDSALGTHVQDITLSYPDNAIHYVCGRARFAHAIEQTLQKDMGDETFYTFVGAERWRLDVYFSPTDELINLPTWDWETIATHNTPDDLWVVIEGVVYDLTQFYALHPGGQDILRVNAGTDATLSFQAINLHKGMAMQRMKAFQIGTVKSNDSPWLKLLHIVMNHEVASELQREMPGRFGQDYLPLADEYFELTTMPLINSLLEEQGATAIMPNKPYAENQNQWFADVKKFVLNQMK